MKFLNIFSTVVAAFFFLALPVRSPAADARITEDFDANWLFSKGDFAAAMMPAFNDGNWRSLNVPHDWSSEGPFSAEYGSGNGYASGGIGWYRKHFRLDAAQKSQLVAIEFDGVYDHSEVWINGQFVGTRPFGFSSFQFDLTPFVKFGSDDNVVAVRVDHSRFADSRYYTGSGIYRDVRLVIADKLHVAHWGVSVTTPTISATGATVRIATLVTNESDSPREISVMAIVHGPPGSAPDGGYACFQESPTVAVPTGKSIAVSLDVKIPWRPWLWDLEHPDLHTVNVRILASKQTIDEEVVAFGIREFISMRTRDFF
jgi:beta-galactosidase